MADEDTQAGMTKQNQSAGQDKKINMEAVEARMAREDSKEKQMDKYYDKVSVNIGDGEKEGWEETQTHRKTRKIR